MITSGRPCSVIPTLYCEGRSRVPDPLDDPAVPLDAVEDRANPLRDVFVAGVVALPSLDVHLRSPSLPRAAGDTRPRRKRAASLSRGTTGSSELRDDGTVVAVNLPLLGRDLDDFVEPVGERLRCEQVVDLDGIALLPGDVGLPLVRC
jgi:hypothetical protein